jgi:general secretion pathway protein M
MSLAVRPLAGPAAAIAILVVVAVGLYVGLAQPLIDDYGGTADSVDRMSALLERYQRIGQSLPALEAELARVKQQPGTQDGFFQGASDALVAAQLQGRLRIAVDAARGELKSTQVLPTVEEGKMRRIAVRGQMSSGLAAAQHVLYELESASPYLFIDNLNIRARASERRMEGAEADPILDVRFDVCGYVLAAK